MDHEESKGVPEKHLLCLTVYAKAFDLLRLTRNCRKILKSWEYQTTNLYEGQEAQLEPDMEQWTVSKLGKDYIKVAYCHPAYLTYMHCEHHAKCLMDWLTHKLETRLPGEISATSDMTAT